MKKSNKKPIYKETLKIDENYGVDELHRLFRYKDRENNIVITDMKHIYSCLVISDLGAISKKYSTDKIVVFDADTLTREVWQGSSILVINCIDENGNIYSCEKTFSDAEDQEKAFEYEIRINNIIHRKEFFLNDLFRRLEKMRSGLF